MSRAIGRCGVFVLTLVCAAAAAGGPEASRTAPGDLTGAWQLNRSLSERGGGPDPEDAPTGVPGRPPGGAGGGLGGPGRGGIGGFGRGEPTERDREAMKDRAERVRAFLEPVDRLTITQDAERVVVVDGQGRTERLVANGRKEQHLIGDVQAELATTWVDGRLVSEISLGRGLSFRRTIGVEPGADGTRRLVIELAAKGGSGGRRPPVKRVYDPIE